MEVVISFPYVQVLALCGIGVYRHITSVFYRDLSIHSLTFSSAYSFSILQLIKAKLFQDLNLHNSAGLLKYISSPSATKKNPPEIVYFSIVKMSQRKISAQIIEPNRLTGSKEP